MFHVTIFLSNIFRYGSSIMCTATRTIAALAVHQEDKIIMVEMHI